MADRFVTMLSEQHKLQVESFGKDPTQLEGEDRTHFIQWNVTALTDELHEMLQEIGWKPWASSRHVNAEPAFKEMVDAFHFFMNILLAIDQDAAILTAERFFSAYMAKRAVNAQRQQEGYDGISGKCQQCHRDLAESECTEELCSAAS